MKELPSGWSKEDVQALLTMVEEGEQILIVGHELGIPTIHDFHKAEMYGFGWFYVDIDGTRYNFNAGGAMNHLTGYMTGYTTIRKENHNDKDTYTYPFEQVIATLKDFLEN
jgi:hypothetical protein